MGHTRGNGDPSSAHTYHTGQGIDVFEKAFKFVSVQMK